MWVGLTELVEGQNRTKRLTSPSRREFSSRLLVDFICTIGSSGCPPAGFWTRTMLTSSGSQACWLMLQILDSFSFPDPMNQFLIIISPLLYIHWLCFTGEPWLMQAGMIIIPILHMRKLRCRDIKWLAQSHTTNEWPRRQGNPDHLPIQTQLHHEVLWSSLFLHLLCVLPTRKHEMRTWTGG